jgi:hypothetical protein
LTVIPLGSSSGVPARCELIDDPRRNRARRPVRDQTGAPVAASSTWIVSPLPTDEPVASTRLPSTTRPLIPPTPGSVHSGAPVAASNA